MEYTVEEVPAASWRPGLPQALACYRIVHEVAGTILETPDASETDERNAHEIVGLLNGAALMRRALEDIQGMTDADDPESYRADDREGCLDTTHSTATTALALVKAQSEKGQ